MHTTKVDCGLCKLVTGLQLGCLPEVPDGRFAFHARSPARSLVLSEISPAFRWPNYRSQHHTTIGSRPFQSHTQLDVLTFSIRSLSCRLHRSVALVFHRRLASHTTSHKVAEGPVAVHPPLPSLLRHGQRSIANKHPCTVSALRSFDSDRICIRIAEEQVPRPRVRCRSHPVAAAAALPFLSVARLSTPSSLSASPAVCFRRSRAVRPLVFSYREPSTQHL